MNDSSVNPPLSVFSYEILGLVGEGGASPHDLLRMARHGRILDWAGESQYYVEPKRLARLGYLEARKAPGKTRERTVYTLTENGRQALADYARTPVTVTPLKSEPLVRLLICDMVGEEVTRDSLATLREDIDDLRARLDESERRAMELPHRAKYMMLVIGFLREFLDAHERLVAAAARELAPDRARPAARASLPPAPQRRRAGEDRPTASQTGPEGHAVARPSGDADVQGLSRAPGP
jgi:DNA-binding PadR family transcriptional regulator